jgi:hypothetical protein
VYVYITDSAGIVKSSLQEKCTICQKKYPGAHSGRERQRAQIPVLRYASGAVLLIQI